MRRLLEACPRRAFPRWRTDAVRGALDHKLSVARTMYAAHANLPAHANAWQRAGSGRAPPSVRLKLAYAAWLFGVFCYFLPAATWSPVSRFSLTRSVVERGTLNINAYADSTGDRARVGGDWFSDKAPLVALAAVPAYQALHWVHLARGKAPVYRSRTIGDRTAARVRVNRAFQRALYVCSVSTSAMSGVAVGLFLFALLRRRATQSDALWGSVIGVLCSPLFPYSTSFYGHAAAGALLVAALSLLDAAQRRTRAPTSLHRLQPGPLLAGACLAASAGCEYMVAVPALVVGFSYVVSSPPRSRLRLAAHLALGALGPTAAVAAYHWACFGAPLRTGYAFIVDPVFAAGHARGWLGLRWPTAEALWGLTFGTRRGLFFVAPVTLALVIGLVGQSLRRDRSAQIALAACTTLVLANASYYMWWGGAAAGPRHLVPILGLLALGLPWLWQTPARRRVTWALAAVSLVNMLTICAVGVEAPAHGNVLFDFAYPRLLQGRVSAISGASNLGIELGIVRGGSLGPLLAWLVVGGHVLWQQLRQTPPTKTAPASPSHPPSP